MSEKSATVRVRVAPSPTGLFHLGLARTALFNWLHARRHSGTFILRIEDTDQARCKPEYTENILDAMRWLRLEWDEGPYVQSERVRIYQQHAAELVEKGAAYRCYCAPERLEEMRKEQQLRKQPPGYDRRCRGLSKAQRDRYEAEGLPHVVRFAAPLDGSTQFNDIIRARISFDNRTLDDFVILKSDGFPTYHLASVVDDQLMGITHVLRGEEWISSTPRHLLLYQAFGWSPPLFAHLPLILGKDRAKLSKRHGALPVTDYREQGYLPDAIVNYAALLGWAPGDDEEVLPREEMVRRFDLSAVNPAPAAFDEEKLEWMNGVYLRALGRDELVDLALPYLQKGGLVSAEPAPHEREYAAKVLALEQERMKLLSDAPQLAAFLFGDRAQYDENAVKKWLKRDYVPGVLRAVADRLKAAGEFDRAEIENLVRALAQEQGRKAAELIHPIRVAVTGRTEGPGLFETLELLGRDRVLLRLEEALSLASPPSA